METNDASLETNDATEQNTKVKNTDVQHKDAAPELKDVLASVGLAEYGKLFEKENIEIQMLLDLKPDEFMNMTKDLGIDTWCHRHKLKRGIVELRNHPKMIEQTISTIDESIGEQTIEQTICTIDESVREKQCDLCDNSNEHFCTLCGKKVCNIFCSEWDPNSSNEMRRKHKLNDPRCTVINFECPTCDSKFQLQEDLEIHICSHENSFQMVSLVSEADDSSWKYVACNECDDRF